jgi:hypothetical protein
MADGKPLEISTAERDGRHTVALTGKLDIAAVLELEALVSKLCAKSTVGAHHRSERPDVTSFIGRGRTSGLEVRRAPGRGASIFRGSAHPGDGEDGDACRGQR